MNSRQDKTLILVETAIYRVFVMIARIFSDLEFSSKNLNRTILASALLPKGEANAKVEEKALRCAICHSYRIQNEF